MNMFEDIDKVKKDLPKVRKVTKEVSNYKLNNYQGFALVLFIICVAIGVILGNLFPVCGSASNFTSKCSTKEFNFILMVSVWSASLLVCIFFFGLGHIIELLKSIDKKLDNRK